jgi:hypothetical protein
LKDSSDTKEEDVDIPPQAKHKKTRTAGHKPKAIPKPIHTLLSGREDRKVSKKAYLDTIAERMQKFKYHSNRNLILMSGISFDIFCSRGMKV